MKNIFKTLGVCLVSGLIFSACANQAAQQSAPVACNSGCNVAFVNVDSLMRNYKLAVKLSDQMMDKRESAEAAFRQKVTELQTAFNAKAQAFQANYEDFQRKVQNNAFLSLERAQDAQKKLQNEEQSLREKEQSYQKEMQVLDAKLSQELAELEANLSKQLNDTLTNFLKEYAEGRYSLILANSVMNNNVLFSAPGVDITEEVINVLNKRYKE